MAVLKQLAKAGAEQVLKKLPIDQADTIVKAFNFKPGSPHEIFVRDGGIHPMDGPGLVNAIKKGEAQDLGQQINYVVQGEQGAYNEIARIADNSTNDLIQDTSKAQQADAIYESQVNELRDLRAEGEKKLKTRGGQDPGSSTLSTGPELISGDKRIYQLNTKLREPYKEYEDLLKSDPVAKKFHHKFMKGQSVPYFERAWELVDAGLASEEDIIALHRYALDAGVGTGDRQSSIMMFERIPHEELHNFMLDIGIQPSATKFSKEGVSASGRKTRIQPSANSPLKRDVKRIKKIETIEDLAADFQQAVDDIAVPMTEEAKLLEEAWQSVDIQLRDKLMDTWNKRNAARKAGNKELAERLNKEYKQLKKESIAQMKTNRARYGKELDEFGNPDPESYGRAEIKQDLKADKQLRGLQ